MDQEEIYRYLARSFPVWERLNAREQAGLAEHTAQVHYEKGARLHGAGTECIGVLFVMRGRLRAYMLSQEGREITLYRLGAGEICILSASCVLSEITFDVHIDAEEDTDALLTGAPYFSALCEQSIYAECFSYKLAAERFSDVMWAMQQLLFMRMDQRLAILLWDEFSKAGSDVIRLTHEQAARCMGSAREVVTRVLRYFVGEGIVSLSRGSIRLLDRKKLRALAFSGEEGV